MRGFIVFEAGGKRHIISPEMINTATVLINKRLNECTFQEFSKVCEALSISIKDLAAYEATARYWGVTCTPAQILLIGTA